ncbi:hypothetical protein AMAG_00366 [Allomyces macrogynus ATCC 38327]|uniref:Uncharacterized protein n=1 Tax=Allomyces macrogynus (strain ATCC 38327) TaxID=578462 RepID=A0A0L0RWD8_ALLM3|nr:hypothetical protein AMAG_00366 [Allomyces macrogynus ATCC 38327]|eukprot:KNE54391.1 hypothetical protein AMAG_00366 [Allomyces macrogynus ATCC 38327]
MPKNNKRLSATGGKSRKPQPRNSPKNKKRASTARVPDTAAAALAVAPAVALTDDAVTDQDTSVADQDASIIDDDDHALPTVEVVEDANGKDEPEPLAEQEEHNEGPAVAPAADEPVPQVVEPVLQIVEPVVVEPIVEEPAVEEPVVQEPAIEPAPAAPAASTYLEPEPASERRRTASTASRTPDATFGGSTGAPSMIRIYLPSSVASNKLQSSMEFMLAPSTDGKTPSFTLRRIPKVTVTPKMPFVLVEQHHAEKLLTMRKELLIKDHAEPKATASAAASAAPRERTVSAHSRVSGAEERSESVWMLEFASDSEDNGHVHYVDEQGVEHDACLVGDDKIEELPSEAVPAPDTAAPEEESTPADAPVTEPVEAPLAAAPQDAAPQEPTPQEPTAVADATPSPSDSAAPSVTDPPAAAAPAPTATEPTPAAATPAPAEPAKTEPAAEPVARALLPADVDDDAGTDSAVVTDSAATSASLRRAAVALPHKDSKDKLMVRLKRSFLSLRRKSSSASLASSSTLARRTSDSSSSADENDEKKVSEPRGSATLARGIATTLPRSSGGKEGKPSLLKKLKHRVSKFGSDSDDEEHEAKKAAKKAAKAEKKAQKLLKKQEKEAAKNAAAGARKSRFGSSA